MRTLILVATAVLTGLVFALIPYTYGDKELAGDFVGDGLLVALGIITFRTSYAAAKVLNGPRK